MQDTPAEVVDRLMLFLAVRGTVESGGDMSFNDA